MSDELHVALQALKMLRLSLQNLELALADAKARVYVIEPVRDEASLVCISDSEIDDSGIDQPILVDALPGFRHDRYWSEAHSRRLAIQSFKRLTRRRDQPPTRPDRRPGLIWAPGRTSEHAARLVNSAKLTFLEAMRQLPTSRVKRKALLAGSELEHVLLLQAYRQISIVTEPVDAISFSWSGASHSVQEISFDSTLKLIRQCKLFDWQSRWERLVIEHASPSFARLRRMAPFPVANCCIGGSWGRRETASMPLLLTGPRWPGHITDLLSYEPPVHLPARGATRQAALTQSRIDPAPLIPELGLHRYIGAPKAKVRHGSKWMPESRRKS